MTVTVKKAGEAATKAVAKSVLKEVTKAEAATAAPHRTSQTTTSMPWKGWVARFMIDKLGQERWDSIKKTAYFMPDDIYDLEQSPKLSEKIPISKTNPEITRSYRTPSPGSQASVRIPEFDETEDPYDTGYFKRDTRRRYESTDLQNPQVEMAKVSLMDPDDPAVQEEKAKIEAGPESSPGNDGKFATGPSDFDPTGLRATMSVSWKKLEESLDSHMPDHLPTPTWEKNKDEILKWHEENDIPVGVGPVYEALKVPTHLRVARW